MYDFQVYLERLNEIYVDLKQTLIHSVHKPLSMCLLFCGGNEWLFLRRGVRAQERGKMANEECPRKVCGKKCVRKTKKLTNTIQLLAVEFENITAGENE